MHALLVSVNIEPGHDEEAQAKWRAVRPHRGEGDGLSPIERMEGAAGGEHGVGRAPQHHLVGRRLHFVT